MTVKNVLCALVLVVAMLLHSGAAAGQTVEWATPDWRPYFIVDGDDKGTGYSDVFLRYFESRLTQYRHQTKIMTLSRYLLNARQKRTTCFCDLLKTPDREALLYYSKPMVLAPALRVYINPNGNVRPEGRTVSVESLLSDPTLRTIVEKGRSYDVIDPLIEKYKGEGVKVEQMTPERIYQLLQEQRIDYLIEYPFALATTERRLGYSGGIVPLRIKEQFPYTVAYVTCSRTPLGREIIAGVNAILDDTRETPEYKALFMRPTEIMSEENRRVYNELWETFLSMDH